MAQYSYKTRSAKTFHAGDYVVFAGMLALSAGIGLFYAIKDRKKNTTDNYLLADRGMHPVPVAMSLTSTFISAIAILGVPAEVYVHSTMFWWLSVGMIVSSFGAAHVFVPIFYNLHVTSVFQVTDKFICSTQHLHPPPPPPKTKKTKQKNALAILLLKLQKQIS